MPGRLRKHGPYGALAAAPAVLIIGGLTAAALLGIAKESLCVYVQSGETARPCAYYAAFLTSPGFWQALAYSFKTAAVSSVLAMAAGIGLAASRSRGGGFLWAAIIAMSYVSAAVAMYDAFGDRGWLARLINIFFAFDGRLNLVHDRRGLGVILLYVFKAAPFTLIACDSLFRRITRQYSSVAAGLGLSPFEFFRHILLPLSRRGLLAIFLVIFVFILFSYEGFYFLGVSIPSSLGELSLRLYSSADLSRRAEAMALSGLMIGAAIICAAVYRSAADAKNSF